MARKQEIIPEYGTVVMKGKTYYRTRITDADGKKASIYGETPEEVFHKVKAAKKQIAEAIFRKENPTVAEYSEKWLAMQSAVVRPNTLKGYRDAIQKHIVSKIGYMYMDEVTADDLKLLMVPVSKCSASLYGTVNMLIKCIFYSAERSKVISLSMVNGLLR